MKKKQITLSKKIGEIKKLKKLFQKVCNLLNDPIEMKDTALRNEAYHEACSNIQERMLNRSKQCLGFSSRPLLHRNSSAIDEQRERIGDVELREAEKIYRRKDPVYAKAVDQYQAEITNLLTEIENCRYFLQDTFQAYPWIKGTLLAGDFEYFRKYYKDLNKPCFVGEITEILEKLNRIQYALERERESETQTEQQEEQTGRVTEMQKLFHFSGEGQAFCEKIDLELPAGRTIETLSKLVSGYPKIVEYSALDSSSVNSASDQLRGDICKINKAFKSKNLPFKVVPKKTVGYLLKRITLDSR
ncbi:MAG: hypothetical protein FVQ84_01480 [Planctomycetes bacterium]|nr:hypothetical protein [Planctomycetota bacterium]